MQVVICDACHSALHGQMTEMHLLFGQAFSTEDGRTALARRGTSKAFNLCAECGSWMDRALQHLRESHERRAFPRVSITVDVVGRVRGSLEPTDMFGARTRDISRGGAALITDADVPEGTEVVLRFRPDDEDAGFELPAVALSRFSSSPNGGDAPLRVQFLDGDDHAYHRLDALLRVGSQNLT